MCGLSLSKPWAHMWAEPVEAKRPCLLDMLRAFMG
jgi:hypothetical protein